jgi:hypothetical protein
MLLALNMPDYGRSIVYGVIILALLLAYGREREERHNAWVSQTDVADDHRFAAQPAGLKRSGIGSPHAITQQSHDRAAAALPAS